MQFQVAYNDGYDARTLRWLIEIVTKNRNRIESFWVDLSDGRILGVPFAWFPRLLNASPEQREQVRISTRGLHWEALDEDISITGLLAGLGDQTTHRKTFAA